MYDQISSNKWKSWGLLFLFVAFVAGIAVVFAKAYHSPFIIPIAAGVAILMAIGSYYNSDKIVIAMSGARPADGPEFAHLQNSVEGLAIAAGLPKPRVYVIDDSAPNAFATGRDPQHAVVCVTTGLMDKMDRVELEGVIGHEMSHVKNYDIRFSTLVVVLVGIIALLSDWFMRSLWWGGGRRRSRDNGSGGNGEIVWFVIAIVVAILAPISAALIQAALSRQREYLADANGALLTRYPEGLASALQKIAQDDEPLEAANKATAALFIENPLLEHGGLVNKLFDTHPPVEERIRRLREM